MKLSSLAIAALLAASPVYADKPARPLATDNRIRALAYDANEIYSITGAYGYSLTVEFDPRETIKMVAFGDSMAWGWNVGRSNILILKPVIDNAETNATVVTDARTYIFALSTIKAAGVNDKRLTFRVRFSYPEDEAKKAAAIAAAMPKPEQVKAPEPKLNTAYTYKGSKRAAPLKMYDDGRFTYLQFSANDPVPAVFLVNSAGNESLVNFRREGELLVVEKIGRQFTLRAGEEVTCVFNEAFPGEQRSELKERT